MMSVDRPEQSRSAERERPRNGGRAATSIANRDNPVFTAMRRHHSSQSDLPEFFTESLNTSYIPSPSPAKIPTHNSKSRRAYRNGRQGGVAAPFRGSRSEDNPGSNERTSSNASSSPHRNTGRPAPQRSRTLDTPARTLDARVSPSRSATSSKIPGRHNGTRTPSPQQQQRGRSLSHLMSPASDASASSPPRGLAEAYRRIEDEEHLAEQEDDESDTSDGERDEKGEEGDGPARMLRDVTNGRDARYMLSPSPESRRSSRRISPRLDLAALATPNNETTPIQQTAKSNGDSHDSSPFEEVTMEERQMNSRHERDQERLKEVLDGNIQPFKKARRRKNRLTVDGLRREDTGSQSGSSASGSHSASSKLSDPSFNIPSGWGRKGRSGKTWLNRITENGSSVKENDTPARNLAEELSQTEERSDQIDEWMAKADAAPLPSIENDSFQPDDTTGLQIPAAFLRGASSYENIKIPESNDEVLLESRSRRDSDTPSVRLRNAAIDAIRQREIESLEKSAVTTNRLGELKEMKSLERVVRRSSSNLSLRKDQVSPVLGRSGSAAVERDAPFSKREETAEDDEKEPLLELSNGMPISESPVVVSSRRPKEDAKHEASVKQDTGEVRPKHTKQDSIEILRTLARVTSASPSPEPPAKSSGMLGEALAALNPWQGKQKDAFSQPPTGKELDSEQIPAKGAETPQQSKQNYYLKTPLVTGAWIETPLPTAGRQTAPSLATIEEKKELVDAALINMGAEDLAKDSSIVVEPAAPPVKLEDTAPKLPKSALAAVIDDVKMKKRGGKANDGEVDDTLQLEDDTLASLEQLVVNSNSNSDPSSPVEKPQQRVENQKHEKPLRPEDDGTTPALTETQMKSRVVSRLGTVTTSMRDANTHLDLLQKHLYEVLVSGKRARSKSRKNALEGVNIEEGDEDACTEAGELHDFIWPCERCGCGGGGGSNGALATLQNDTRDGSLFQWQWQPIFVPMPKLWYRPSPVQLPRPTRAGYTLLICTILLITELILLDAYSPPFYAESMVGFGVDYTTPRPPFILAKLVWRVLYRDWTAEGGFGFGLGRFLRPVENLFGMLIRLLEELFGWRFAVWDPFDDPYGFDYDYYRGKHINWRFTESVAADLWGEDVGLGSDRAL